MFTRILAGLSLAAGFIVSIGAPAQAAPAVSPGDVFAVVARGGSGMTEVHALRRSDSYHSFSAQMVTGLGATSLTTWTYGIGDYDGDGVPDLFAVNSRDNGGANTAAHVFSGASNFKTAILHRRLPNMGATNLDVWQFFVGDYNGDRRADLIAIDSRDNGGANTAAHVFDAATGLNSYLLHRRLPNMGSAALDVWQFAAGDYNGDGKADLFAVNTRDNGSANTAAHVLNAATGYNSYLLHRRLPNMGSASLTTWQFSAGDHNVDGRADLVAVNSQDGSGKTAVHVLDATTGFNSYLMHSASALHRTNLSAWQFHGWPGRAQQPPSIRDIIVWIAATRIGDSEANGGCLEFGPCRDYAWCAMFTNWVWRESGVSPAPTSWVATGVGQWGVDHGRFKPRPAGSRGNPLPGDIVVYGAPNSGTGGHVAIVASVNADGTIDTIDGNVSNRVLRQRINPVTATSGTRNVGISGYVSPTPL